MAKQKRTGRPKLPKRLCQDPNTKYCKGHHNSKYPYGHRGCCECHEVNAGDEWQAPCNPYLLPQEIAELKIWWADNDMGPWEDSSYRNNYHRPKMKMRGSRG